MASAPIPGERPRPAPDPEVERTLGLGKHRRRRGWIKWVVIVALLALAVLGVGRCLRARALAAIPTYETAKVTRGDLELTISANGTLQALNTVEVGAEVSGRVTQVLVDFNDKVTKGQLLAVIDPEQPQAAVDEAAANVAASQASIAQAKATVDETTLALARSEKEVAAGLSSVQSLEAARASAARAKATQASAFAQATVANANLKSAKSRLEKTKILSPTDGVVLSRLVQPGQTVTAGFQTPILFKLTGDLREMSLHVYIDEADIGRVREGLGASFTVDAYPGRTFPSKILSIRNEPRTEQGVVSYEAVLSVDNEDRVLRPGMTATASIVSETKKDVLLVPNAALRFTPPAPPKGLGPQAPPPLAVGGPRVFVESRAPNGFVTPKSTPVEVGLSDGTNTIVEGGLDEDQEVIVDVKAAR